MLRLRDFVFCLDTDMPLTAGLADSDIFYLTNNLTAIAVAYPAQFWQKYMAIFLIEFPP